MNTQNLSYKNRSVLEIFHGELSLEKKKIVLGTLKAEKRILNDFQIEEKIEYFTELAKEISKLGSVMLLDVMNEKDIEEFIYKKYRMMSLQGEVFSLLNMNSESSVEKTESENNPEITETS